MYAKPRLDWDHDHCEFCTEKSAEKDDIPGALHEGYASKDVPVAEMDIGGLAIDALMISKISSNGRLLSLEP